MSNRPTGETALSYIRAELSLDKGALKRLKETLRDPNNPTTAALSDRVVSYLVKGAGRGAKTYLVKHAA